MSKKNLLLRPSKTPGIKTQYKVFWSVKEKSKLYTSLTCNKQIDHKTQKTQNRMYLVCLSCLKDLKSFDIKFNINILNGPYKII